MSPSLWWDREYFLRSLDDGGDWADGCRVWLDAGGREGASEAGMRAMIRRVTSLAHFLENRGVRPGERLAFYIDEEGLHNEASWGGRFNRVLQFLFGQRP
jgi:predicted alpha/beta superfamily hydrolase